MELTSFYFLCFYAAVLILYYIVPVIFKGRGQWVVLLAASVSYYYMAEGGKLLLYPFFASFVTWTLVMVLTKLDKKQIAARRSVLILELFILLGILVGLKYIRFVYADTISLAVPLGLSFYTFMLLGYFIDVYNGICEPQTNLLKTCLYGMYFPLMTSGPIVKLREGGKQFFERHELEYNNITFGMQRMLWGFFKELVISQRLGKVVDTVYAQDSGYAGIYVWFATACFAFQLYTNFSGCMDIVIGLSETFGLVMPENFRTPFLAKNISEYWRRWHATLGIWMKDNLFYPLLRTKFFMNQAKKFKKKFGKKLGKQLNTWLAMLILWTAVGLWHGGDLKYVIGSGILHWSYIVIGEATLPFFTWLFGEKLHINMEGKAADVFRVVRTFFLVNLGFVFFRASSTGHAIKLLVAGVSTFNITELFNGHIFDLGLDFVEMTVAFVSIVVLIVVSVLQYKMDQKAETDKNYVGPRNVRQLIASKHLILRWAIWFALIMYVILLGEYGPGYSAAEFIYEGF